MELTIASTNETEKLYGDGTIETKAAIGFDLIRYLKILEWIDIRTEPIFGKSSWYLQLPDLPERIKHIRDCGSSIPSSGHSPILECPDILANTIHQLTSS